MLRSTCLQMTRAAAILALALLCAQTLVVIHDHQLAEHELCVVCGTAAEHAASPAPGLSLTSCLAGSATQAIRLAAPAQTGTDSCQARAPPIA